MAGATYSTGRLPVRGFIASQHRRFSSADPAVPGG